MKTITVTVQIQMDIFPTGRKPELSCVQDVLETMDKIIGMSELDSQPQIFIEGLSNSDILEGEAQD